MVGVRHSMGARTGEDWIHPALFPERGTEAHPFRAHRFPSKPVCSKRVGLTDKDYDNSNAQDGVAHEEIMNKVHHKIEILPKH